MRYRSSTALEDSAPGGSVAGARMAMNGAPWWTTLGDDGGRNNNVVVRKNLGPRAFFTKKNNPLSNFLCYVRGIT